jgi:BirA family transcriptional regulator, biotin operon repressor / biotin---[acetyl-CoA-carboxylase] ligase
MSVRLPMPGTGHARAGLVPLAAGLGARETVLALGAAADRVELKWPNDLMDPLTGRKLAGILCESGTTAGAAPVVVIGIGLNLSLPPEIDGVVAKRAQWLSEIGADAINPVKAAAVLATAVARVVAQLDADFEAVIGRIRDECATIGRNVRVEQFAETFDGTAVGVDDRGALIVERADTGTQVSVHAADVVHLRRTADPTSVSTAGDGTSGFTR